MFSRAAYSAAETAACASMSSSSTPKAAFISGPRGSISRSPIFSTCRTKSSRALRTRSTPQLFAAEGDGRNEARTPTPWTSVSGDGLVQQGVALTMWRNRAAFSIARSSRIPKMLTRLLDRRARMRPEGALVLLADPIAAFAFTAEAKLTKALSSVPDHALGHMALGLVHILTELSEEGIAECEHALAARPKLAHAHSSNRIRQMFCRTRRRNGSPHVAEALRIDPRDTMSHMWMNYAGIAKGKPGSWERPCRQSHGVGVDRGQPKLSEFAFLDALALAQLGHSTRRVALPRRTGLNPAFCPFPRPVPPGPR